MRSVDDFKLAVKALEVCGPSWEIQPERVNAFMQMGHFFEQTIRPGQLYDLAERMPNPVWEVVYGCLRRALHGVDAVELRGDEVLLWQLYNAGFIVQAGDVKIGADVVPVLRTYGWKDEDGLTRRVAGLIDMLLITHHHPDHYDRELVKHCLQLGKPVLAPRTVGREWGDDPNMYVFEEGGRIELCDVEIVARTGIHVWREGEEDVPSLYYEVCDRLGFCMMITGDVDYTKRFEKTPGRRLDVLFLTWRNPNGRYEAGDGREVVGTTRDAVEVALARIEPSMLVLEHYGELEHIHKGWAASYDMAAALKRELKVPVEWLFWGERMRLNSLITETNS
jgi:L-ascorbate metabolism protein UlaG (beta-lactamase superfamily)